MGDVGVREPEAGSMLTPSVRLVKPLRAGGMGRLWLAEHRGLKTEVVVKLMARELLSSDDARARFEREAFAASQVKSPHVVQLLDYGIAEPDVPYIVMELLEGQDLADRLATGPLSANEAADVLTQLARALSRAHERGIVHRDIKPSNIFLCDADGDAHFVKLLDFGIAKAEPAAMAMTKENGEPLVHTSTGSFLGSPYYMSPEQVIGDKSITYRTDLWSLGVVAFEMLTGQKPFFADTVGGLALKIHRDPLPILSERAELPKSVDAWFHKACSRHPDGRFESAREMADAFALAVSGNASVSVVVSSIEVRKSQRSRTRVSLLAAAIAVSALATGYALTTLTGKPHTSGSAAGDSAAGNSVASGSIETKNLSANAARVAPVFSATESPAAHPPSDVETNPLDVRSATTVSPPTAPPPVATQKTASVAPPTGFSSKRVPNGSGSGHSDRPVAAASSATTLTASPPTPSTPAGHASARPRGSEDDIK